MAYILRIAIMREERREIEMAEETIPTKRQRRGSLGSSVVVPDKGRWVASCGVDVDEVLADAYALLTHGEEKFEKMKTVGRIFARYVSRKAEHMGRLLNSLYLFVMILTTVATSNHQR